MTSTTAHSDNAAVPRIEWARLRSAGGAILTATLIVAVLTLILDARALATGAEHDELELGWTSLLPGLAMAIPGALLLIRMPRHAVAWVLAGGGLFWAVDGLAASWLVNATAESPPLPGAGLAFFIFVRLGAGLLLVLPLLVLLFPDGRLPSGWWGRASIVSLASTALLPLALAFVPSDLAEQQAGEPLGPEFDGVNVDPLSIPLPDRVWEVVLDVAYLLIPLSLVFPLVVVARRYVTSRGVRRLQLRWLLWAAVVDAAVVLLAFMLNDTFASIGLIVAVALTSGAIVVAITQYRLYDIDPLLSSTLAYGGLAAGVVLLDLAMLAVAGSALDERESALVALVVVTAVYAPLRARGWGWARRLLRGDRDDPYAVLATVASSLERADDTDDQLSTVVHTLRSAFRSPYARCEIVQPGGERLVVEDGTPGGETVRLPITYRGEEVGSLELAPSRASRLNARDQLLLGDVLRQAAAATRATRLARELQTSRARLVVAREEERRRLRRDLHDGLGPSLAAVRLRIQTARNLAPTDSEAADALLAETGSDVAAIVADVRRLVHDLRPPALDERGLAGALEQLAGRLGSGGQTRIAVTATEPLDVSAAVEVAAYRIASEALANVVRHAQASTCTVTLGAAQDAGRWLLVEVADDGIGVPDQARAGVGLASLRERAGELGGRVSVESTPGAGTVVRAWLPWRLTTNEGVSTSATA